MIQKINIGIVANDFTGDGLRTAMDKINDNFDESLKSIYNINTPSLVSTTGTSASVFIANNTPAEKSGYISQMEILSNDTGTAKFTIMKRNTYLYPTPAGGDQEYFGKIKDFTIAVAAGRSIYTLPEKVWINKGEFIGWAYTGAGDARATTTDLAYPLGWWQVDSGIIPVSGIQATYQVGSVGFSFTVETPFYKASPEIEDIIVTRNANNFNSIRELMATITNATEIHKVRIVVPEGEWRECDIVGKQNVIIEGAGIDKTVIFNRGDFHGFQVPGDYSFSTYGFFYPDAIPQQYSHVVHAQMPVTMKNLTLRADGCKYTVHNDNDMQNDLIDFENVKFLAIDNVSSCVGLGLHGVSIGQKALFDKCIFESMHSDHFGIFMHNCNNQLLPVELTIRNSRFNNCQTLLLNELGSEQPDQVNLLNCFSDGGGAITYGVDNNGADSYWINPATGLAEPDPTLVPYNLRVDTLGSNIMHITPSIFGGTMNIVSRPNWHKYINTDYFSISKTTSAITKGDLVGGLKFGDSVFAQTYNGNFPVLGIAITSLADGEVKIAGKSKISYALVSGIFSNYIKIQGNVLIFTDASQAIGYAVSNDPIDGLYPIILY